MKILQIILSKIIALASGYAAASIWIVEDNSYINVLPIILLALSIKVGLRDLNDK
jgi:hypothetical protein